MKIYLAGRYLLRNKLRKHAKELRSLGHYITSRWLGERSDTNTKIHEVTPAMHKSYAIRDLEDIDDADVFVLFTKEPARNKRGGHHVEFGYALARGKQCAVVGKRENTFHYLPAIDVYDTFEGYLHKLETEGLNE